MVPAGAATGSGRRSFRPSDHTRPGARGPPPAAGGSDTPRAPAAERRALAAPWSAANRLVPTGYYVGVVAADDVLCVAPHLSRAQAGAFVQACEDEWSGHLIRGARADDLVYELLRAHGLDAPSVEDDRDSPVSESAQPDASEAAE